MTRRQYWTYSTLLIIIGIVFIFELIRDSSKTGDFIGYVKTGNLVLSGKNIYSEYLNTWPPFFSVFSVVLAIGDRWSSFLIRFLWNTGNIIAMYYIVFLAVKMVYNKPLTLKGNRNGILIQEPIVMLPVLIILRFVMDNLANIQINIYLLLCTLLAIVFFTKKKYIWVGLLLGLTISLKVYTIFFLLYFLFKREFKPVVWTLLFIAVFNAIPLLVYGFDQGLAYYRHYVTTAPPLVYLADYKNQSIYSLFLRFFTSDDIGISMHVNLFDIKSQTVKLITFGAIALASVYPAYLFRKKLIDKKGIRSIFEYSFIFTMTPILSPVAWKAYFIFLWIPYFLLYSILFRATNQLRKKQLIQLKSLFWLSIVLNVFSTELIIGRYFSDMMEACACITLGTLILLAIQLFVVNNINQFDLNTMPILNNPYLNQEKPNDSL